MSVGCHRCMGAGGPCEETGWAHCPALWPGAWAAWVTWATLRVCRRAGDLLGPAAGGLRPWACGGPFWTSREDRRAQGGPARSQAPRLVSSGPGLTTDPKAAPCPEGRTRWAPCQSKHGAAGTGRDGGLDTLRATGEGKGDQEDEPRTQDRVDDFASGLPFLSTDARQRPRPLCARPALGLSPLRPVCCPGRRHTPEPGHHLGGPGGLAWPASGTGPEG